MPVGLQLYVLDSFLSTDVALGTFRSFLILHAELYRRFLLTVIQPPLVFLLNSENSKMTFFRAGVIGSLHLPSPGGLFRTQKTEHLIFSPHV